ncbi:MAG: hypothetical protein N2484_02095 [Clostridia bacterium]|nr:hypothetical protein [Clostridia bacterium]
MKRTILTLALLWSVIYGFYPALAAEANLQPWKYFKEVRVEGANKYKAVYLDEDVYRDAQPNLEDLRIADSEGNFVPYYLENSYSYPVREKETYTATRIGSFVKDNDAYVDFKVQPARENSDILGSRLAFFVSEQKFLKTIDLYGSFDGVNWQYIMKDSLYKVDNISKTEVDFKEIQKFSFYRVKVPNNLEKIDINGLQVVYNYFEKRENSYEKAVPIEYEMKNEAQHTELTIKNSNKLKIKKVNLDIEGIFNRSYSVYTGQGDEFMPAGISGELYNLHFKDLDISDTSIETGSYPLSSESIRVKIVNMDDKPLKIKGIQVQYYVDKIVFEDTGSKPFRLYYGNTETKRPVYDLEKYKEHIEKEQQDTCSLGTSTRQVKTKSGEPEKRSMDSGRIFNIIVIIVAAGLIFLIALKLGKQNKRP